MPQSPLFKDRQAWTSREMQKFWTDRTLQVFGAPRKEIVGPI
jgi:hypothetical protein